MWWRLLRTLAFAGVLAGLKMGRERANTFMRTRASDNRPHARPKRNTTVNWIGHCEIPCQLVLRLVRFWRLTTVAKISKFPSRLKDQSYDCHPSHLRCVGC
jgi:hypothetical protein